VGPFRWRDTLAGMLLHLLDDKSPSYCVQYSICLVASRRFHAPAWERAHSGFPRVNVTKRPVLNF